WCFLIRTPKVILALLSICSVSDCLLCFQALSFPHLPVRPLTGPMLYTIRLVPCNDFDKGFLYRESERHSDSLRHTKNSGLYRKLPLRRRCRRTHLLLFYTRVYYSTQTRD